MADTLVGAVDNTEGETVGRTVKTAVGWDVIIAVGIAVGMEVLGFKVGCVVNGRLVGRGDGALEG